MLKFTQSVLNFAKIASKSQKLLYEVIDEILLSKFVLLNLIKTTKFMKRLIKFLANPHQIRQVHKIGF